MVFYFKLIFILSIALVTYHFYRLSSYCRQFTVPPYDERSLIWR